VVSRDRQVVDSDDLADHLHFVMQLLYRCRAIRAASSKMRKLRERTHSAAHVTCLWRGDPGELVAQIPTQFKSAIEPLAADIETDFAPGKNSQGGSVTRSPTIPRPSCGDFDGLRSAQPILR